MNSGVLNVFNFWSRSAVSETRNAKAACDRCVLHEYRAVVSSQAEVLPLFGRCCCFLLSSAYRLVMLSKLKTVCGPHAEELLN